MSEPFAQYPYGQYGQYPAPEPPRRHRGRTVLSMAATAIVAAGVGAGAAVGLSHGGSSGSTAASTSQSGLSAAQIASKVDPSLVDVTSTLGDEPEAETAMGTGMVLSSNGIVLTNNHVINGATAISVTDIGNGKTYKATVVGYDESQDIAVLQLSGASGLTTANLGNSSSVSVGNAVTALGNAGGKGGTPSVATGSVVALNQSITASDESSGTSEQLSGLIESNADIQPGDSGGPLVNSSGQIIGIDTAASSNYQFSGNGDNGSGGFGDGGSGNTGGSSSGGGFGGFGGGFGDNGGGFGGSGENGSGFGGSGSSGSGSSGSGSSNTGGGSGSADGSTTQGYSIPINNALSVAKQIEAGQGSSTVHIGGTAFIGLEISPTQDATSGVEISGAAQGTAAAQAGLTDGDVVTSLDGQSVTTGTQIQDILVGKQPGNKVSIAWTDPSGQSHTATITLTSGPAA